MKMERKKKLERIVEALKTYKQATKLLDMHDVLLRHGCTDRHRHFIGNGKSLWVDKCVLSKHMCSLRGWQKI